MERTLAQRIVDTLHVRANGGIFPQDYDAQMAVDVDAMTARYQELRITHGFGEADRIAKLEFVSKLLGQDI